MRQEPDLTFLMAQLILRYDLSVSLCANILHESFVFLEKLLVPFEPFQQVLRPLLGDLLVVGHHYIGVAEWQLQVVMTIGKCC